MDTAGCVAQIVRLREAGCRIVRLTAQGRREAENLGNIVKAVREQGLDDVAFVADIHFNPAAAFVAAEYVDKVRINPGNFGDPSVEFVRLIAKCRERGIAIRIGVNHGSLAPHIVERWGDTPQGMVGSAMEYLRICHRERFDRVVVSMKSSNVRVMVQAYRLLSAAMPEEDMHCPLHLGVTEAGDGADGRIKSAVGIGALLSDGLGDTIRVSLTESPENEIPVAIAIIKHFEERENHSHIESVKDESLYSPYEYRRRTSIPVGRIGGANVPVLWSELTIDEINAATMLEAVTSNPSGEWRARILNMTAAGDMRPVILRRRYGDMPLDELRIKAAADFGPLFIDGLADGMDIIAGSNVTRVEADELSLSILQAARVRMSKTEYIACPGCGRTLYDIQKTLTAIRSRTSHMKGLKIAVMGCIVNGPGEMADADYGYVGEGAGRVTLYRGREVVMRSIPESEAIEALAEQIETDERFPAHGDLSLR